MFSDLCVLTLFNLTLILCSELNKVLGRGLRLNYGIYSAFPVRSLEVHDLFVLIPKIELRSCPALLTLSAAQKSLSFMKMSVAHVPPREIGARSTHNANWTARLIDTFTLNTPIQHFYDNLNFMQMQA